MAKRGQEERDTGAGFGFALTAYFLWGFLPLYMKLLDHIPAPEIVVHRVIWSIPVAGLVLIVLRRTGDLLAAFRNPAMLGMALVTAAIISINWGIYVWAITAERAVDAALGYFINPLFSVFLGAVLLKERLEIAQILAIGLASIAVLILVTRAEEIPWAAFGLTLTWGFYAFFKRSLPIGPNQGFMLEVLILSPFAFGYFLYLTATGETHFGGSMRDMLLLIGTGIATAVPLMIYANGAKRLRLSTIGILQYVAPTMIFATAVFIFDEPFGSARALAFPLIWAALAIYSWSMLSQARRK